MQSLVYAGVSSPCVPVSTAETPCVSPENGHEVSCVYELAEAINCLIDAGYKLGCDGELLPPKWAYEAFKEADA